MSVKQERGSVWLDNDIPEEGEDNIVAENGRGTLDSAWVASAVIFCTGRRETLESLNTTSAKVFRHDCFADCLPLELPDGRVSVPVLEG